MASRNTLSTRKEKLIESKRYFFDKSANNGFLLVQSIKYILFSFISPPVPLPFQSSYQSFFQPFP
jgi:hypothetical protein